MSDFSISRGSAVIVTHFDHVLQDLIEILRLSEFLDVLVCTGLSTTYCTVIWATSILCVTVLRISSMSLLRYN